MKIRSGQSAESAIGFGGRLQRHDSTGLCSSGVVFDPHRPYQSLLIANTLGLRPVVLYQN